jgi:hypothetical protein
LVVNRGVNTPLHGLTRGSRSGDLLAVIQRN